jgi:hypothetical protein
MCNKTFFIPKSLSDHECDLNPPLAAENLKYWLEVLTFELVKTAGLNFVVNFHAIIVATKENLIQYSMVQLNTS